MREKIIEIWVGCFILIGILALLVLAFKVSGLGKDSGDEGYKISAIFDNVGGLKVRSPVSLAGVHIGEVTAIRLDNNRFKAIVTMKINPKYQLPIDTSASILTQGLLGANYISFIPGFSKTLLTNNSVIQDTHPALILEDLIGQLVFSLKNSGGTK